MSMKTISVADLKANLSQHLKSVAGGERLVVTSRGEPVAELVPHQASGEDALARMAREGRIRLGTQDWSTLEITPLSKKASNIQRILDEVREDGS